MYLQYNTMVTYVHHNGNANTCNGKHYINNGNVYILNVKKFR